MPAMFVLVYTPVYICTDGAGLVFCSTKRKNNTGRLLDYIVHQLYSAELLHKCQLADKELLFVPSGWDSAEKINLDFEAQRVCIFYNYVSQIKVCRDATAPYESIIKDPNASNKLVITNFYRNSLLRIQQPQLM